MSHSVSEAVDRTGRFLDAHPVVRWFVAPLVFMGGIVVVLGIALRIAPVGVTQLALGYLAVSAAAIVLGVAVERFVVALVDR